MPFPRETMEWIDRLYSINDTLLTRLRHQNRSVANTRKIRELVDRNKQLDETLRTNRLTPEAVAAIELAMYGQRVKMDYYDRVFSDRKSLPPEILNRHFTNAVKAQHSFAAHARILQAAHDRLSAKPLRKAADRRVLETIKARLAEEKFQAALAWTPRRP